jgi:hypothetical protein
VADGDVTGLSDEEIDALTDEQRDALNDEQTESAGEEEPMDNRAAFLDWFAEHFRTIEVTDSRESAPWCPEWWLHPEVNARLWALFLAHQEVVTSESLGALSDWWLRHWDAHRAVLFNPTTGPFKDCSTTKGHLTQRTRNTSIIAIDAVLPPDEWQPPVVE